MGGRFCGPGLWAEGFVTTGKAGSRWTRKVSLIPSKLAEPLAWRKPHRVFVNSMSDLLGAYPVERPAGSSMVLYGPRLHEREAGLCWKFKSKKGGNMDEWPEDLRIREQV